MSTPPNTTPNSAEAKTTITRIEIEEIFQRLPHRYPLLLVDRVLDYEPMQYLRAVKNVTFNEPQFQGHFPGRPIFPGVMLIEALAQATGILASVSRKIDTDNIYYLAAVDNCRFRRAAVPGDVLILHVESLGLPKRNIWRFAAKALLEDKVCAEMNIMCASR